MYKQFIVLSLLLASFVLSGCGLSRPSVENLNFASVGYKHTGLETTCSACHEGTRPVSSSAFTGANAGIPFNYTKHGSGTDYADCIVCHNMTTTDARTKSSWSNGGFHNSIAMQPSSCLGCHDTERPSVDVVYISSAAAALPTITAATFDHTNNGQGDCITCHKTPNNFTDVYYPMAAFSFSPTSGTITTTGTYSSSGWWEGSGQPTGLVGTGSFTITVKTPTVINYSQTTSSGSFMFPFSIDHEVIDGVQTAVAASDCATCHDQSKGRFHIKITTGSISSCSECHANAEPTGFVSSSSKWFMNHAAVAWTGDIANGFSKGSTDILSNHECSACHTYASTGTPFSNTASSTSFHANVTGLTSCMDCHLGSKPSISAGTTTGWANSGWTSRKNGSTSLFTNGVMSSGTLTGTLRTGLTTFDLSSHAKSLDCAVCHAVAPITFGTLASAWGTSTTAGTFNHRDASNALLDSNANCLTCHTYPSTGTFVLSAASFSHLNQTGNCASCHGNSPNNFNTSPSMADWYPGAAFPTTMTSISTITGGTYSGIGDFKVPTLGSISYSILGMVHTQGTLGVSTNFTLVSGGSFTVTGGSIAVSDCVVCHRSYPSKPATNTTGTFHLNVNINPATAASTCTICHDPSIVPTAAKSIWTAGVVGANRGTGLGIDHSKITAGTTCMNCHTAPTATSGTTRWATAATVHNDSSISGKTAVTATSCVGCHYNKMTAGTLARALQTETLIGAGTYGGTTSSQKFTHSGLTTAQQACGTCHTAPANGDGTTFKSTGAAVFHKKVRVAATNCNICHVDPKGSVGSTHNSIVYAPKTHTGNNDCSTCHQAAVTAATNAVTAGSSPAVLDWVGGSGHAATGPTNGNCLECHNSNSTEVTNGTYKLPSWNLATTSTGTSSHMGFSIGAVVSGPATVNATALITMGSNSSTVTSYTSLNPSTTVVCAGLTVTAGSSVFKTTGTTNTTTGALSLQNKSTVKITNLPVTLSGTCTVSSAANSCTTCHLDYTNFINAATNAVLTPTAVTGGTFPVATGGTYVKYAHSNGNTNFTSCYTCHQFNKGPTNLAVASQSYTLAQYTAGVTAGSINSGTYYFALSNPKAYMQTTGTFTAQYKTGNKIVHAISGTGKLNLNISNCTDCHSYTNGWIVNSHPNKNGNNITCQQCHSGSSCTSADSTHICGGTGMPACGTSKSCN